MGERQHKTVEAHIERDQLPIRMAQVSSLRTALLQQKATEQHHRLRQPKLLRRMLDDYTAGDTIRNIGVTFDLPPLAALRAIFEALYSKRGTGLKRMLQAGVQQLELQRQNEEHGAVGREQEAGGQEAVKSPVRACALRPHDLDMLRQAMQHDIVAQPVQHDAAAHADAFEAAVCAAVERSIRAAEAARAAVPGRRQRCYCCEESHLGL